MSEEIKEGDIFRWSYRDPGDDRDYGRYHCCSRIAVVTKGQLLDTFWLHDPQQPKGYDTGRLFTSDDLPRLDLEYLGNFADLEKADEWKAEYYNDTDIVNLNHSNSSRNNFYLRKGAKRSQAKMLEVARYKLDRAESKKRSAEHDAERLRETIAKIEAGEIADVYL